MNSLLSRLWERRGLGHLIQGVLAGLTALPSATLLAAPPRTPPESREAPRRLRCRAPAGVLMPVQVTVSRPLKGSPVAHEMPAAPV